VPYDHLILEPAPKWTDVSALLIDGSPGIGPGDTEAAGALVFTETKISAAGYSSPKR